LEEAAGESPGRGSGSVAARAREISMGAPGASAARKGCARRGDGRVAADIAGRGRGLEGWAGTSMSQA